MHPDRHPPQSSCTCPPLRRQSHAWQGCAARVLILATTASLGYGALIRRKEVVKIQLEMILIQIYVGLSL